MTRPELDELIRLAADEEILGELDAEQRRPLLRAALYGRTPFSNERIDAMNGAELATFARMIADNLRGLR